MKIVIKTTEGVQIMTLVGDSNVGEVLSKWGDLHPNKYISHREMPDSAIPSDRTFRDAWSDTTPELTIDIDMAKARSIHLERIRTKRNAELATLDIGDTVTLAQIRARKQELRDLPATLAPTLASAVSVDALKAIQPLT